MAEKIKEEWVELLEESKKFGEGIEIFFKEKAPRVRPEEPEVEDREIEEIAEIAEVREKREEEILSYPNVVGVATGYKIKADKVTPDLCMQVLVEKKIKEEVLAESEIVPKDVEGIKTDVIATGRIEVTGRIESLKYTGRYRPAWPGASIGHVNYFAGTFGCLVQDKKDHDFLILSANHVLTNNFQASINDPILQPGRMDGGVYPRDIFARLKRFIPMVSGYNLVDAAVAKPVDQRLVIGNIPCIGIPKGTANARLGWTVRKTGRTTQYTTGRVTSIDATVKIRWSFRVVYLFKNQILTTNMYKGGDAGSLLVDPYARAVGLSFAGSSVITVHNHISNVLMGLGVEMVEAL